MNKLKLYGIIFLLLSSMTIFAQRQNVLLNDNWAFRFSHQVQKKTERRVDVPHTWNAQDALSGKHDYKRGIGNYEKHILVENQWKGKRLFLRFEGVNNVANVFINRKHIGEHRGGYGAFVFEITDCVNYGKKNSIWVRVNNAEQLDVMPLLGDFNFYGGIYRDVSLIITEESTISLLDYASSGVYLSQSEVSEKSAKVSSKIMLSSKNGLADAEIQIRVLNKNKVVFEEKSTISLPQGESQQKIDFTLNKPHLWNGQADPFMYQVEVILKKGEQILDKIVQPLGLRYYNIDPNKGFFLNGKHLPLYGVCRHQDRAELGNALHPMHHEEDTELMLEMGVNAVRLAHYPQSTFTYDLMDKHGFIIWAEIPFIGPGGYEDKGFIDMKSFRDNGKEQLKELIRQHYNHPSICMWGLFNEIKVIGDNPIEYVKELNELAHKEDPTRPTTGASNQESVGLNSITDIIAWNRYDGWYGGMPVNLGLWLDKTHEKNPSFRIAISEYGAGGSIYHQQEALKKTVPTAWWHPENWQTHYHIENWKVISARPYLWGSFVWNMFDFGAAHRTEGDRPGINDKGMVTFDRKDRKDVFYFYKANWNKKETVLYLADKRLKKRTNEKQNFMAFTTLPEVELFVNGESKGRVKTDAYATVRWENVAIEKGENTIEIKSIGKKPITDSVIIIGGF